MTALMMTRASVQHMGGKSLARYRNRQDRLVTGELELRTHERWSEQRAIVNQPIDAVVAFLRRNGWEAETPSLLSARHEGIADLDPVSRRTLTIMGREVEVTYTFYAIPGGTQITATTKPQSNPVLDPIGTFALTSARRQIAVELDTVKDNLE